VRSSARVNRWRMTSAVAVDPGIVSGQRVERHEPTSEPVAPESIRRRRNGDGGQALGAQRQRALRVSHIAAANRSASAAAGLVHSPQQLSTGPQPGNTQGVVPVGVRFVPSSTERTGLVHAGAVTDRPDRPIGQPLSEYGRPNLVGDEAVDLYGPVGRRRRRGSCARVRGWRDAATSAARVITSARIWTRRSARRRPPKTG
jgi:hypothetical protein